jgi:hypothetical protein
MQNLTAAILLITLWSLSSCATYRNGQTPDDVYFAREPEFDDYVRFDNNDEVDAYREDRQIRMQIRNRNFRSFNDPLCYDPSNIIIRNNDCYCITNNGLVPFIPQKQIKATPVLQSGLSNLGTSSQTQPLRTGKYVIQPKPDNGSRFFHGATNQNNIKYSRQSGSDNNQNSGSRYFQNNASGSQNSSTIRNGSSQSGRRN